MTIKQLWWPFALLCALWVVQVINLITGYTLNEWFGLLPRRMSGLDGILFSPLLHGSVAHLAANTVPLLVFGSLMAITAQRVTLVASAVVIVLGGFGVWLFGKTAIHIGASGLIFGWFAFLLARGFIEKRTTPLLVTVAIAVVYGAMLWGVFPGEPGVSWESHLFGALAGVFAAFFTRGDAKP